MDVLEYSSRVWRMVCSESMVSSRMSSDRRYVESQKAAAEPVESFAGYSLVMDTVNRQSVGEEQARRQ